MNTFKKFTDTQLVTIFQEDQNSQAFGELYSRYNQKMFLYCVKIVKDRDNALDLTQDIFIKISKKIGQLNDNVTFVKWMFTIAHNDCIDFLKKQKKTTKVSTEELFHLEDTPFDIEIAEEKELALNHLEMAMKFLSEEERTLIHEKYFGKMSVQDLMKKYGLSASAVKMRLARTRKKIGQIFEEPALFM